jgi:hypothetical protein
MILIGSCIALIIQTEKEEKEMEIIHLIDPDDGFNVCEAPVDERARTHDTDEVTCPKCIEGWFGIKEGEDS